MAALAPAPSIIAETIAHGNRHLYHPRHDDLSLSLSPSPRQVVLGLNVGDCFGRDPVPQSCITVYTYIHTCTQT